MLDRLSDKFQSFLKKLKGEAHLTESNVEPALREIRIALLEADVNYRAVKDFVSALREKLLGEEVRNSLSPYQTVVKIVHHELTVLLGGEGKRELKSSGGTDLYMLIGLQGAGKTTTAGKLAHLLLRKGKVLMISLDLKRAAAQEQLEKIAKWAGADFLPAPSSLDRAFSIIGEIRRSGKYAAIIVDTAGRLHVDEELMEELRKTKNGLSPTEVIIVADAMTGQEAVRVAKEFNEKVGFDSVILTKMDGDARGGAALSITYATSRPIKFIGVGEKIEDLEAFVPERMASRILGMGDILTLIEKTEKAVEEEQARKLAAKLKKNAFTLDDLKEQIRLLRKLGGLKKIIPFLPKMPGIGAVDDRKLIHMEAIINSMTPEERERPEIIKASRKRRIARGSGRPVHEVNQLLRGFFQMKKMLKSKQVRNMLKGIDI